MGCGASLDAGGGGGSTTLDYRGVTELPTDAFRRLGITSLVLRQVGFLARSPPLPLLCLSLTQGTRARAAVKRRCCAPRSRGALAGSWLSVTGGCFLSL